MATKKISVVVGLVLVFLLSPAFDCRAQWLTQSFDLKAGWNAVFLHVDASHETLDSLVGDDIANPILEIWRWNPPSTVQFDADPQQPTGTGSEWSSWVRGNANFGLHALVGDSAYLVRVGTNVNSYVWNVKGRPVAPRRQWSVTGQNLLGFSANPSNPPSMDTFLATAPELHSLTTEVFQYVGGELGANNPVRVTALRNTPVNRGEAFWIRSGDTYNQYFGPFEIQLTSSGGANFGDDVSTYSLRLRNLTANPLSVTLQLAASESVPGGQTPIAGLPPLLVRGELSLTNLTYGFTNISTSNPHSWNLAARDEEGSEVEVVLGLDRASITGNIGDYLAGILRFTDSLGHSQVDVPVSAVVSSSAGLWVGGAAVTQVGQYLKSYQRQDENLVVSTNGNYIVTNIDTDLAGVPAPFPLRLIVHNPSGGSSVLLQRVYFGVDGLTNPVVATQEGLLNENYIDDARRISATHLPWSDTNEGWEFDDLLSQGTTMTASITNRFDDQASNPFLHTYHPDHDNLDSRFSNPLPQGSESYTVVRDITLNVTAPGNDFGSRTGGDQSLSGDYVETIRMLGLARAGGTNDTRRFEVRGIFTLNHISDVSALTTP